MTDAPKARGRPATGRKPVRNVRVADDLWKPALALARERGETITSVIESALKRYVSRSRS